MLKIIALAALALGLASCSKLGSGEYFPLNEGMQWRYTLDYVMPDGKKKEELIIRAVGHQSFKRQTL